MLLKKIRELKNGKILFVAENGFPDYFLSVCRNSGIELFSVKSYTSSVSAECEEKYFESLKYVAKKTGMDIRLIKRTGLPYFIYRYKERIGIPIGLAAALVLFLLLSNCIWEIDVEGNEKIPPEIFTDILEENGVHIGSFKSKADAHKLAYEIERRTDGISWVAVNIKGTKMTVEVRERIEKPEIRNEKDFCNIIASADGEIVRADIYSGVSYVKIGDAVIKGDLLVGGVIPSENGNRFISPQADISARTVSEIRCSAKKNSTVKKIDRCKDVYLLNFFFLHIPIGSAGEFDEISVNDYSFTTQNSVLPIGFTRKRFISLCEKNNNNKDVDFLLCFSDFSERFYDRYKNSDIEKFSVNIRSGANTSIVSKCTAIEKICERKSFFVEEN